MATKRTLQQNPRTGLIHSSACSNQQRPPSGCLSRAHWLGLCRQCDPQGAPRSQLAPSCQVSNQRSLPQWYRGTRTVMQVGVPPPGRKHWRNLGACYSLSLRPQRMPASLSPGHSDCCHHCLLLCLRINLWSPGWRLTPRCRRLNRSCS